MLVLRNTLLVLALHSSAALRLAVARGPTRAAVTVATTTHARSSVIVACDADGEGSSPRYYESVASQKAAEMAANVRTFNAEEEKALRICRIEFAPYPSGKYNKIMTEEEGLKADKREEMKAAAYEAARKDMPALVSWSDLEIEATVAELQSTPSELLIQSPIGPFLVLSGIAIFRDGLDLGDLGGIPPCQDYLGLCTGILASWKSLHSSSAAYTSSVSSARPHAAASRAASAMQLTAEALRAAPNPEAVGKEHDILLRAARGETVERTPVWLMRQAGRYMAAFREYSNKLEFRQRSETPEIATELSLQPWRAFGVDGVIMFSDILTPLPALGVEFDVVRGTGPVIPKPLRTAADVAALTPLEDPDSKLPFIRTILGDLRKETEGRTTLLGFVGSPFTLVSYSVEGQANRHCIATKKMMVNAPEVLHAALDHYAIAVGQYACHQIECGAQCVQFFESWAHHLGAGQFALFAKPYADKAMAYVKERHPDVPLVYYANGGSPYLDLQKDMAADVISLDWSTDMATARTILGSDRLVQGNVDPTVLFGDEATIRAAVADNIAAAGGQGKHLLNLGHGVLQGTPEDAVAAFVDAAKRG